MLCDQVQIWKKLDKVSEIIKCKFTKHKLVVSGEIEFVYNRSMQ